MSENEDAALSQEVSDEGGRKEEPPAQPSPHQIQALLDAYPKLDWLAASTIWAVYLKEGNFDKLLHDDEESSAQKNVAE